MMKHMAVVGTGTIGLMLGAFLARGGHDVTVVSQFRPEMAELLRRDGIRVSFGPEEWTQPVRAAFWRELPAEERFDILFITGKSNDTADALEKMLPYLAEDGFVSSLQNGINDELIAARAGAGRVIPCVCFAGGQCPEPNHVITHDGRFIIGEPSGERTERLSGLAEILSCVKRVEMTDDILAARWKKLSEVCITVPSATVSGYPLFGGYEDRRVRRVFGLLAQEVMAVERACGVEPEPIMGLTAPEWSVLAEDDDPALREKFLQCSRPPIPPGGAAPGGPRLAPEDAYTQDIRRGRPLEIWYTNGYLAEKAKLYGVAAPVNDRLLDMIRRIEAGELGACPENLEKLAEGASHA